MKNRSLAKYGKHDKGKIIITTLGIVGIVGASIGAGIGIGYACFHKKASINPIDPINPVDPNIVPDSLLDLNGTEVEGFSDAVINDHSLLQPYNTLDLHGRTLSGKVHFDRDTFNSWECKRIDLSNTIWNFEQIPSTNNWASGYRAFEVDGTTGYDMSHVEEINLHGADFGSQAPTGKNVLTANFTFLGVKTPALKILDLSNTIFTNSSFDVTSNIKTAVSTFQDMDQLSNLTDVYLPSTSDFQTWTTTFDALHSLNAGGTIHWSGYINNNYPINWTTTWFSGWTWTDQMTI